LKKQNNAVIAPNGRCNCCIVDVFNAQVVTQKRKFWTRNINKWTINLLDEHKNAKNYASIIAIFFGRIS